MQNTPDDETASSELRTKWAETGAIWVELEHDTWERHQPRHRVARARLESESTETGVGHFLDA